MLVKLIIDNFLSFENEVELTMIPSNKTRKLLNHKVPLGSNLSLLKNAVIYGANAAGKSNLIEAFHFIKYCVANSIPLEATNKFCKAHENNIKRPSLFELQFTVNGTIYAYGFTAVLNERKVVSEWLYELYQNGSQRALFERLENQKPIIGDSINLSTAELNRISTYIDDFDVTSNFLFLKFMNQDKKYSSDSKIRFFRDVFNWICDCLYVVTPNTKLRGFEYYYDEASLTLINDLIKVFDTGITNISIVETSMDELRKKIPVPIFDDIMQEIKRKSDESNNSEFKLSMRSDSDFYNFEFKKDSEPIITTISLKHGKSFYDFSYDEESDGTRRLFDLLDMLLNKSNNIVYLVDEMERSLHPKLTSKFIELFEEIHQQHKMQLIFTTHESSIMDQELFRRDEIWFVERNASSNSQIYSLDRFKERYDKKLSKAYLEGRYGAIPVFTSFSFKEE